jgi:hypothetical protein
VKLSEEVLNIPIRSYFILDVGGVPIFARRYEASEGRVLEDSDAVLLAGFLAAVEMFSRTNLHGNLIDIGFEKERYYFYKKPQNGNFLVVASTDTSYIPSSKKSLDSLFNIIEKSFDAFELLVETASKMDLDLHDAAKSFGSTLDSIIIETPLDTTDDIVSENYEILTKKVQETGNADFDQTIDKVGKILSSDVNKTQKQKKSSKN